MRPVLSEQAQSEVRVTSLRIHRGWQTILDDRGWLDNHPASASQTEIPMELDSVQTLEFIGFDGNTVGELYDSWYPEGEDSLLQHTKEHLAEMYDQAPGRTEIRRLLPAMGMSRTFNDRIWKMVEQIRRDHRFANTTVEKRNIKQWAEVEIGTRFNALRNLNNRILGRRIETLYQASYELTHKDVKNNEGVPNGFLKRDGLLEPTYHQLPRLPAGPRLWAIDPAMMANFRAAPMEDGRIEYVAQEPTGYTVPNNDGSQNVYVGRHKPPPGHGDQHGRGGAPKFGQGQTLDEISQSQWYVQEHLQAQLGGQRPAWDRPTPGMQQSPAGYANQHGHGAAPNFGGIAQNQFYVQDQLRAQLRGQLPASDCPTPNAQLRNPYDYTSIQIGAHACAPVWASLDGNQMDIDAPPPYSAQPPSQ